MEASVEVVVDITMATEMAEITITTILVIIHTARISVPAKPSRNTTKLRRSCLKTSGITLLQSLNLLCP
jgi:hypothetical protein